MMLISPTRLHHDLLAVLSPTADAGPHSALFILPEGRLLASATRYDELYVVEQEDEDAHDDDAPDVGGISVGGYGGPSTAVASEGGEGEEEEEEEEEPYLDEPERLRLLCGLASQWEEDESPRVECEVSPPSSAGRTGSQTATRRKADYYSSVGCYWSLYPCRPPVDRVRCRKTYQQPRGCSRRCLCWF
jgi:hypothetical protein